MESKKDHINVSVRIRPVLSQDNSSSSSLQIISKEPPVLLAVERSQTYHFDNIFSEEVDQEKVYNDAVKPFVECVRRGYNCTVFAYGQTGTGKTYTMGSGSQNTNDQYHKGIIPRALEQLFNEDHLSSEEEIDVYVSFSEIYNEKVFDLLQPEKKYPLPVSGFAVQGLNVKNVKNIAGANELLDLGNKNRHVGETRQNIASSRSHAIFTVYFTLKNSCDEISGKLNLVDLAGSESVRKTGSKGSTFQEGININKGLLSIGQVISALSMKSGYIPYRQSMITSILQGSLNVDNYISLIACVSGDPEDTTETLQTLDFAQRTKKVRSNPEVNKVIAKYRTESRTPMKRPHSTPMKTPAAKKMTLPLLPLINESCQSRASNVDSSRSQFSINISTASSKISPATGFTQQTLSPVIRKYMTKMEESIMDRLETVIKSTLRRPTRASLRAEKSRLDMEKENTPNLHWSRLQNEVSKMVRNEIAHMTVGATSSPIENEEKITAKRLLIYDDSPPSEPVKSTSPEQLHADDIHFKVPQLPVNKKKRQKCSKILSPIENAMQKPTPRRSMRLSLKQTLNDSLIILNDSETSFDATKRSIRQSLNKTNNTTLISNSNTLNDASFELGVRDKLSQPEKDAFYRPDDSGSDFEDSPSTTRKLLRRQSTRLAKKRKISPGCCSPAWAPNKKRNIAKTPAAKVLVERALKKTKAKDSPYTSHSKRVLHVLNRGTQKEVERLYTIGVKTAEQILLFRKLGGNFNDIEGLSKLPGWGRKKYEKFVCLNFLMKD